MIEGTAFHVAIAAMSAAAVLAMVVGNQRARSRQRTLQLVQVRRAMTAFYEAAPHVIDDVTVPESVREVIEFFAVIIDDRRLSGIVVEKLLSASEPVSDGSERRADLSRVLEENPRAAENLLRAFHSGLFVLFNRWPENARLFGRTMEGIAFERRAEQLMFKKMARVKNSVQESIYDAGNANLIAV